MKKAAQKILLKKVNKPEEGLTVSQSQQLDTFERASTLDEKRLAAVQMIQSGLLPNTLATIDQLDDPETREKAIGGVIAIIEYGRDENHTLDRLEWNARRAGKVVMGIHMYMGLALKNNILVDEDYRKMYSASDKLS
jgi:hypothetical protein